MNYKPHPVTVTVIGCGFYVFEGIIEHNNVKLNVSVLAPHIWPLENFCLLIDVNVSVSLLIKKEVISVEYKRII